MSASGGMRHMIDTASWAPRDVPRRGVEAADIEFALARRPRMGWQNIAKILGVNALSLQQACEARLAPAPKKTATAAEPSGAPSERHIRRLKPMSAEADVLLALAKGCLTHEDVTARAHVTLATSRDYVSRLKTAGLVSGRDEKGRWLLSLTGWAEVRALRAGEADDHG